MKVAKEQIVGMVAAVDWFLSQPMRRLKRNSAAAPKESPRSSRIFRRSTSSVVIPNVAANAVPHLLLRYDTQRIKIRPVEVMAELRKGTPSIELNPHTGKNREPDCRPTKTPSW